MLLASIAAGCTFLGFQRSGVSLERNDMLGVLIWYVIGVIALTLTVMAFHAAA